VAKEGYAARVKDTRSYDSIRYVEFLSFHHYPESYVTYFAARIFYRGGHFR
jgi:hypothetical protein